MIISHKYKFIFIKTMKTASSSIEMNYGKHFMGPDDVLSMMDEDPDIEQNNRGWFNPIPEMLDGSYTLYKTAFQFYHKFKFGPHQSARVIQHRVPKRIWNSYYKFTVERNPYDKMASMYYMNWGKNGIDRPGKTIADWVARGENFPFNFPLYSWKGNVIVDKVIRYENLNEELSAVYKSLGVPFSGLTEKAKGGYRKNNDYRTLFDAKTKQQITELFKPEIDLFGYEFE